MNIMKELTTGKIKRSLQRFIDFANDLSQSDMNTFEDRLKLLMNYCKTDSVFSVIHEQLINVPNVDFDSWYEKASSTKKGMPGSGDLIFPTDLDERMSMMYLLLNKVNDDEIELTGFARIFFITADSRIDTLIHAFNEAVVMPLARELSYRITDLEEEMPENDREKYPLTHVQIVHTAQNVVQQSAAGENIRQEATLEVNGELKNLFNELRQELQKTIKDKEKLVEALQVVESAEKMTPEGASSLPSVKALLTSLGVTGNIASIASAIYTILSNIS